MHLWGHGSLHHLFDLCCFWVGNELWKVRRWKDTKDSMVFFFGAKKGFPFIFKYLQISQVKYKATSSEETSTVESRWKRGKLVTPSIITGRLCTRRRNGHYKGPAKNQKLLVGWWVGWLIFCIFCTPKGNDIITYKIETHINLYIWYNRRNIIHYQTVYIISSIFPNFEGISFRDFSLKALTLYVSLTTWILPQRELSHWIRDTFLESIPPGSRMDGDRHSH